MPRHEAPIYRRGKYWLGPDLRADGTPRSPFLAVFWYDPATRRTCSRSTKTAAVEAAIVALDRIYLADTTEAPAFCPTCGRASPSARAYLLTDAIADYRLEVGDARPSAGSIRARLGNVLDFLDATGRSTASCADAGGLIAPLRTWLAAKPVTWRNKAGEVTVSKPRTPAAVEEAIHQLRAVLNHAHAEKRIEAAPDFKGRSRKDVSAQRTERVGIDELAAMLRYAADPRYTRRRPLHAFLVASLCTLARPDAVFDISTDPKRKQLRTKALIDLNQEGRVQTRKRRPMLPVPPPLASWLDDVAADKKAKGWLCEVAGEPVASIDTAWKAMLVELGLPGGREMQPYVVRHSLATLLRDRGASAWDVEGQLGHRTAGTSEIYAISTLFVTAQTALRTVLADLENLAPGAMHRRRVGVGSNIVRLGSALSA